MRECGNYETNPISTIDETHTSGRILGRFGIIHAEFSASALLKRSRNMGSPALDFKTQVLDLSASRGELLGERLFPKDFPKEQPERNETSRRIDVRIPDRT